MKRYFLCMLAALTVPAAAAQAGTVSINNGQINWQSTRCAMPVEPPSLLAVNSETRAEDMNVLMTQYNGYVQQMQAYMDCVSNEAQTDSGAAAQAITHSAQSIIENAQQHVTTLGATLNGKR